MAFYHGSLKELELGLKIVPQKYGYVQQEAETYLSGFEEFLESLRPKDKISRYDAVFMVRDSETIEKLCGHTEFIYRVEPIGESSRHDLSWYTKATRYFPKNKKKAREFALKYWSGEEFIEPKNSRSRLTYWNGKEEVELDSRFEWLVKAAVVCERL
jgi:hypothetical protein